MSGAIFLTGATGFVGRRLGREARAAGRAVYGLVRAGSALPNELIALGMVPLQGDVRLSGLGLSAPDLERLRADVTDVVHAAALREPESDQLASDVNVGGTVRTMDVARTLPRLRRFVHVSSISVAGAHPSRFYEDWLDVGQSFPNTYSRTKYQAELEVRRAQDLPTIVVRPGSIVGDSDTGESDPGASAFDRILSMVWKVRKLPRLVPLPRPYPRSRLMPAVPIDHVARATLALARLPAPRAMTYCLADPTPARLAVAVDRVSDLMGAPRFRLPMPLAALQTAVRLPVVRPALERVRFPVSSVAYLDCRLEFDTHNAVQALAPLGLRCPSLLAYVDTLVDAFVARATRPR